MYHKLIHTHAFQYTYHNTYACMYTYKHQINTPNQNNDSYDVFFFKSELLHVRHTYTHIYMHETYIYTYTQVARLVNMTGADFGTLSGLTSFSPSQFGLVITGTVEVLIAGLYTFCVTSSDGSIVSDVVVVRVCVLCVLSLGLGRVCVCVDR